MYLKIDMQTNWDEKFLTQVEYFSYVTGMKSISVSWDVPPGWDVSPHVNSPSVTYLYNDKNIVSMLIYVNKIHKHKT